MKSSCAIRFSKSLFAFCRAPVRILTLVSNSSLAFCRAFSYVLTSVISREIPNVPVIVLRESKIGIFVVKTQCSGCPGADSRSIFPIIGWPVFMILCSSSKASRACSIAKKSKSVFPMAFAGSSNPNIFASDLLIQRKRLSRSLK